MFMVLSSWPKSGWSPTLIVCHCHCIITAVCQCITERSHHLQQTVQRKHATRPCTPWATSTAQAAWHQPRDMLMTACCTRTGPGQVRCHQRLLRHHRSVPVTAHYIHSITTQVNTDDINCQWPHTPVYPFNGPLSRTTRVSWYQKGKTNLDFTEARDSEWQWNPLGHMQLHLAPDR